MLLCTTLCSSQSVPLGVPSGGSRAFLLSLHPSFFGLSFLIMHLLNKARAFCPMTCVCALPLYCCLLLLYFQEGNGNGRALGTIFFRVFEPLSEDTHILNSTSMCRGTLTGSSRLSAEGSAWTWRMWAEVILVLKGKEETPDGLGSPCHLLPPPGAMQAHINTLTSPQYGPTP